MTQFAPGIASPSEIEREIPRGAPVAPRLRVRIGEVVAFLARRFRPDSIVLFGSQVHGRPTPESDVDLMVVMATSPDPGQHWCDIQEAVRLEFGSILPRFDIKVMTLERVRRGLAENDFFVVDVITTGVVLVGGAENEGERVDESRPGPKRAALEWLSMADDDLRVARMVVGMPEPPLGLACFHAQQGAEKYLKALLQEREIRFPRTHKLDVLADLAGPTLPRISALRAELEWLTTFSVNVRYPQAGVPAPDAERALRAAEAVGTEVRAELGKAGSAK